MFNKFQHNIKVRSLGPMVTICKYVNKIWQNQFAQDNICFISSVV